MSALIHKIWPKKAKSDKKMKKLGEIGLIGIFLPQKYIILFPSSPARSVQKLPATGEWTMVICKSMRQPSSWVIDLTGLRQAPVKELGI